VGRSAAGRRVHGQAATGLGVFAESPTGYALRTNGRFKADRISGLAAIPAGRRSATMSPGVAIGQLDTADDEGRERGRSISW
jgi:hypothetical protein